MNLAARRFVISSSVALLALGTLAGCDRKPAEVRPPTSSPGTQPMPSDTAPTLPTPPASAPSR